MSKAAIYDEYYAAQQSIEEQYGPQSIVLMMVGSFYEMYGVDLSNGNPPVQIGKVEEAHNILGMNMVPKNKLRPHSKDNPYIVGFPDYALDEHLGKLLRANFTVAIYDQYDLSSNKKAKKGRKLTHVYTPSTYIDDTTADTNGLLALELVEYRSPITKQLLKKVHIAMLCLSTGQVYLSEAYDTREDTGKAESELYRILHTFNPAEIIYCGPIDKKFSRAYDVGTKKVYFRDIPKEYRKPHYQNEFLKKIYNQSKKKLLTPIEYIGLEKHTSVIPHLIQALQFAFEQDKLIVNRIHKPEFIENREHLILNNDSIYQLNLIDSPFEVSTTVYDIICKAKTAMGRRCVRRRLLTPITNVIELDNRYNLVDCMRDVYPEYGEMLRGIADIEKKYRKMVLRTLHPYELADLKGTFTTIQGLLTKAAKMFGIKRKVQREYTCFYNEYIGNFDFSVMKRCKLNDIKGSFFIEGVNEELDNMEVKLLSKKKVLYNITRDLASLIDSDKDKVVNLGSTDKDGYFLKMTRRRFKMLPTSFKIKYTYNGKEYNICRKDLETVTLKKDVKIFSPQIKIISTDIFSQRDRMNQTITVEYLNILDHYVQDYGDILTRVSDIISEIDFIYSAARVSVENGYTRPRIIDIQHGSSYIDITGLRHPIVEKINDDEEYTPNDIKLGIDKHYGSVVYGLNMSGKSCLLKSVGCNIVLAQAGMFTSCSEFKYFPFKNLLSKMTIRDNISKGQSTFMIEMLDVKNMLMRADSNTLVLSDELCSSTESTSGHAIVAQTLHSLSEKGAKFIFSTHLHELQQISLITEDKHIKIYHFKVHIDGEIIVFDRKIEEGGMTELYGLEVARALGLNNDFMRGAFAVRDQLTRRQTEILPVKTSRYSNKKLMDVCEKCGATDNLVTHHIRSQKDADDHGMIDNRFHKNCKFNLQNLCEECHRKTHKYTSE